MALNNQQANSIQAVTNFTKTIADPIPGQPPSLKEIIGTPGQELEKQMILLSEMVNKLNKPILGAFAQDMISVLVTWLNDPEVLCCLIQGIWSSYLASSEDPLNSLIKKADGQFKLGESNFVKYLDMLITFIDFICVFISEDIKKITLFIPDFIKEIMTAIMGAILTVVQQTVFALRDSVIKSILNWIDNADNERTWSKCLPLQQMINILKKYISDYGMLVDLLDKIKGFVGGLKLDLQTKQQILPNVVDLEFLYWLKQLLIKLKLSVLNFDFCVNYDFIPGPGVTANDNSSSQGSGAPVPSNLSSVNNNTGDPGLSQGYTIDANGDILVDRNKIKDNNGAWIPRVSNSFIRDFIHNEYGTPYEVIDNTINRATSADNIQGTLMTGQAIMDRCANTPAASEILSWILNLQSR